jgi:serine/threonine-protein kinase
VSRALARAHRNGIVHRDLKPENVFLVWDDEDQTDVAKVVDFGIAKFTDTEASGISSATKTGSILGTPYYMSPEQARGLKNLDARSDNWSLGVIAYEALTGERPFDGEAVGDLLVKICTADPVAPSQRVPNLPPALDEWMSRALNRDPDQRFQDVREMAEGLITVAGLPGRGTLGSAIGGLDETTGVTPGLAPHAAAATTTHTQGSPKATSGAVTHAAMGVDAVGGPPVNKTNPLIYAGAAVLVWRR